MAKKLKGIFPALLTACSDSGEVDIESEKRLVTFLIEKGVHGLTPMVMGGEFYKFSDEERRKVIEIVVDEANGKVPVIAGTSHSGTDPTVKLSRHAEEAGADAIIVMPPYFSAIESSLDVETHFKAVSRAVDIPLMIQDDDGEVTGVHMCPDLIAKMAEENDNIRYIKVEGLHSMGKIQQIKNLAGDKLTVFGGMGGKNMLEELALGSEGNIPGAAIPEMFVGPFEDFMRGDREKAWTTFDWYRPFLEFCLLNAISWVEIEMTTLRMRGVIASTYRRGPSVPLNKRATKELEAVLRRIKIL